MISPGQEPCVRIGSRPPGDPPDPAAGLILRPCPLAPGRARDWLHGRLGGQGDGAAELLLSELVTNAVCHGSGPVAITIRQEGSLICCEVHDRGPGQPRPCQPGPDGEEGRGLALVAAMAQDWGVRRDPGTRPGKTVWFALPA